MAKVLLSNDHKLTILWLKLIEITSQKDLNLRRIAKKNHNYLLCGRKPRF
jgi:hypothetical protein